MDFTELRNYLPQIIATIVVVAMLPVTKYIARKLVKKYGRMARMSTPRIRQVRQVIAIILNILFIVVIIVIWGVKPQNIVLGLSSMFAILGVAFFAQWSMLSNVTAGILMYFSAPYHAGNKIQIIDKDIPILATIELIGTFYTHIRTEEDELIVIPNNLFFQKMVAVKKDPKPAARSESQSGKKSAARK